MKIAEVKGLVIASSKTDKLENPAFLLVQQVDNKGNPLAKPFVALDQIGAKTNEIVLITEGSSCRQTDQTFEKPVDALICGIIDNIESDSEYTYQKDLGFI